MFNKIVSIIIVVSFVVTNMAYGLPMQGKYTESALRAPGLGTPGAPVGDIREALEGKGPHRGYDVGEDGTVTTFPVKPDGVKSFPVAVPGQGIGDWFREKWLQQNLRRVESESTNFSRRYKAIEALGKTKDPRAVLALIKALEDDDSGICGKAAESLGKIKDPAAIPALIELLSNEDAHARRETAKALCEIADPRLLPLTEALHKIDYRKIIFRPLHDNDIKLIQMCLTTGETFTCSTIPAKAYQMDDPKGGWSVIDKQAEIHILPPNEISAAKAFPSWQDEIGTFGEQLRQNGITLPGNVTSGEALSMLHFADEKGHVSIIALDQGTLVQWANPLASKERPLDEDINAATRLRLTIVYYLAKGLREKGRRLGFLLDRPALEAVNETGNEEARVSAMMEKGLLPADFKEVIKDVPFVVQMEETRGKRGIVQDEFYTAARREGFKVEEAIALGAKMIKSNVFFYCGPHLTDEELEFNARQWRFIKDLAAECRRNNIGYVSEILFMVPVDKKPAEAAHQKTKEYIKAHAQATLEAAKYMRGIKGVTLQKLAYPHFGEAAMELIPQQERIDALKALSKIVPQGWLILSAAEGWETFMMKVEEAMLDGSAVGALVGRSPIKNITQKVQNATGAMVDAIKPYGELRKVLQTEGIERLLILLGYVDKAPASVWRGLGLTKKQAELMPSLAEGTKSFPMVAEEPYIADITKQLEGLCAELTIDETSLVKIILDSINPAQFVTDIAEAGGRKTADVADELYKIDMLNGIIVSYRNQNMPAAMAADRYTIQQFSKLIIDIASKQNASAQRISDIIFNCIQPITFVQKLAVERSPKQLAHILQQYLALALIGTTYRVMNLKQEKTGRIITLKAEDIVRPGVLSAYSPYLSVKVTLPEDFEVDEGQYRAVMEHLNQVAAFAATRKYNYRGGVEVSAYYQEFLDTEAAAYNAFIEKNFGGRSNIKYIISSGIGANEMHSRLMAALHNLFRSEKGIKWIVIDSPADIKNLPEDATSKNTLVIEFSRSGDTQETLKIAQFTRIRFPKRIVYANKGPLRMFAEALKARPGYAIEIRNIAQDIGGRLMRRKTPMLLGPMYLAGMDTNAYTNATVLSDFKLDFAKFENSPAVVLARFLYICVVLQNRHNLALMYNNREFLGPSAGELRQLWMEGANKNPLYSLIINMNEFPRDPHASMEGVLGQAASHIAFGIVSRSSGAHDDLTLLSEDDLIGLEDDARQQHAGLSITDIDHGLAIPNLDKCRKVMPTITIEMEALSLEEAAALSTLYEDMTVHYCALTGQDPNSNPQVKEVRENTWRRFNQMAIEKGGAKAFPQLADSEKGYGVGDVMNPLQEELDRFISAQPSGLDIDALRALQKDVAQAETKVPRANAEEGLQADALLSINKALDRIEGIRNVMGLSHTAAYISSKLDDIVTRDHTGEEITATIVINDAEIPEEQNVIVGLLRKGSAYREELIKRLGANVVLASQYDPGKDRTSHMIVISNTEIEGLVDAKYLDVTTVPDDSFLHLPSVIVFAKGLLVYDVLRSSDVKQQLSNLYRALARAPLEDTLLENFIEESVFTLKLPRPTPIDKQSYETLQRLALQALIAA